METEALELLPGRIHGGETIKVSITISGYIPATHTLSYHFAAAVATTVPATENGLGWTLTVPADTTVQWGSGHVPFVGMATAKDTDAIVTAVDEGRILVTASPAFTAWANTALVAIEAAILDRATDAQSNMAIGDMSIGHMRVDELIKMRDWLKSEVIRQRQGSVLKILRGRYC